MLKQFIGTRAFYKTLFSVAAPLVLQQLITSSVQLVDNLMVGTLGDSALGSVAVVNQLYFVVMLIMFGTMGGAGIMTSQYFGSKNHDRLRQTFRFKVLAGILLSTLAWLTFTFFGHWLVQAFAKEPSLIESALDYMAIAKWSAFPFALTIAISNTFRETGITKPLLFISTTAILSNAFLNWLLIFGNWGLPAMGVSGAAVATLIARLIELGLALILLFTRGSVFRFKLRTLFHIDKEVLKLTMKMAYPLMINEALWSLGQTAFFLAYSTRGEVALSAMSVSGTVSQLVFVTFGAIGTGISVMVGATLGAGKLEEAKDNARKLVAFGCAFAFTAGVLLFVSSFFILDLYQNISDAAKTIARFNIRVNSAFISVYAFNVAMYFTLRSGGDTKSTLLMDSGYMWVITVPFAMVLAYFTSMEVTMMFLLIQFLDIPKAFFAFSRYKKGRWIQNLAADHASHPAVAI
jgi:putative MATE family efflux protein